MMTFADFEPGTALGEHPFTLSADAVEQWTGLFPDDRASLPTMPPAIVVWLASIAPPTGVPSTGSVACPAAL